MSEHISYRIEDQKLPLHTVAAIHDIARTAVHSSISEKFEAHGALYPTHIVYSPEPFPLLQLNAKSWHETRLGNLIERNNFNTTILAVDYINGKPFLYTSGDSIFALTAEQEASMQALSLTATVARILRNLRK